jgi:hypothetical protein
VGRAAARHTALIGRRVLLGVRIVHWDRAGETWSRADRFGEVVAAHPGGWVTAVTDDSEPVHVPASRLYRAGPGGFRTEPTGAVVEPEYVGFLEVTRAFFVPGPQVPVRWLRRAEALAELRAAETG